MIVYSNGNQRRGPVNAVRPHGPVQNRSPDTVGSEHMIESAFRRFLNDEP
jgi:hypothetical protein